MALNIRRRRRRSSLTTASCPFMAAAGVDNSCNTKYALLSTSQPETAPLLDSTNSAASPARLATMRPNTSRRRSLSSSGHYLSYRERSERPRRLDESTAPREAIQTMIQLVGQEQTAQAEMFAQQQEAQTALLNRLAEKSSTAIKETTISLRYTTAKP
ncbi:hypothetical protein EDB81DRAFT_808036 [Dactylonectria macrodidyma]|uniref:Uncharacterized protein n=1 Tax=Dactylonectria macrodidyma TaxID=307937 RepID=A0A9P9ISU8_9HYPO|nr:hypothetical protein EDB81DRAFT_808036 [Dactylonectria macrodidyma]